MKTIAIFFGGNSLEHEISLITAKRVIDAFDLNKYKLLLVYIDKEQNCHLCQKVPSSEDFFSPSFWLKHGKKVSITSDLHGGALLRKKRYPFDVALPLVHGRGIEDGSLIGLFQFFNIPYLGGQLLDSALGMDKHLSKVVAKSLGVKVVKSISFDLNFADFEEIIAESEKLSYPLILKANTLGSSIGIKKVETRDQLKEGVKQIHKFDRYLLVEKCLEDFCEFNIAIFEEKEQLVVSSIEKVSNHNRTLSFDDKYDHQDNQKVLKELPANIDKKLADKIITQAKSIYRGFKCSGLVRLDFLFDNTTANLYFSEINIIPGSLAYYLFPIRFDQLLDRLIIKGRFDYLSKKRYVNSLSNYKINHLLINGSKK